MLNHTVVVIVCVQKKFGQNFILSFQAVHLGVGILIRSQPQYSGVYNRGAGLSGCSGK